MWQSINIIMFISAIALIIYSVKSEDADDPGMVFYFVIGIMVMILSISSEIAYFN